MSPFSPFQALLDAGRPPAASEAPTVAWLGLDVPVEIVEAAGCAPVRLRPDPAAPGRGGDDLSEGGGHPGMRAAIARLLDGSLEPLDRVAIGSTPVTGVWIYNLLLSLGQDRGGAWAVDLVDIGRRDRPSATTHNLKAFADYARVFGSSSGDAALSHAIRTRNALRASLRRVEGLRVGPDPHLTGAQARLVLDAVDLLPSAEALARVDAFLQYAPALPVMAGEPVVYSGTGGPALGLYRALEAQGMRIVGDDQDFGSRAIGPDVSEEGDPIAALAERYRRRSPAPAGWTTRARTDYLLGLATERQATAVVFELAPFDHPAAWDQPHQARALREAGVQVIVLPHDAWRNPTAAAAHVEPAFRGAAHV